MRKNYLGSTYHLTCHPLRIFKKMKHFSLTCASSLSIAIQETDMLKYNWILIDLLLKYKQKVKLQTQQSEDNVHRKSQQPYKIPSI